MKHVNKKQVGQSEFQDEKTKLIYSLKYYQLIYQNFNKNETYYGASVEKTLNQEILEVAYSGSITEDLNEIDSLLKILELGAVTPCVLCEVLDELMCST